MEQAKEAATLLKPTSGFFEWQKIKVDLLLVFVAAIWGSTFLIVKDTVTLTGPFTFLAIRFGSGAIVLAIVFRKRLVKITRSEIISGLVIGTFLFAGYAFQTSGLQYTTASKAGFITGLYVPFVPIVSIFILRQWPTFEAVIGILLSVIGLTLLSLNTDFNLQFGLGELLVLGCAIAFTFHLVFISRFAPKADAINLTIVQIALTSVLSLLAMPIANEPFVLPSVPVWISAITMGILATAFALVVMNRVQQFVSSTHAALIYALEPVFSGILGYIAGESLGLAGWIGCFFIFAGMICSELKIRSLLGSLRKRTTQKL